jgi:hypothetical protein
MSNPANFLQSFEQKEGLLSFSQPPLVLKKPNRGATDRQKEYSEECSLRTTVQ